VVGLAVPLQSPQINSTGAQCQFLLLIVMFTRGLLSERRERRATDATSSWLQILNGTLFWQWTGGCSFTRTSFSLWAIMMLLERYPGQVCLAPSYRVVCIWTRITGAIMMRSQTPVEAGWSPTAGFVVRVGMLWHPKRTFWGAIALPLEFAARQKPSHVLTRDTYSTDRCMFDIGAGMPISKEVCNPQHRQLVTELVEGERELWSLF
jgi:hypothetical protein